MISMLLGSMLGSAASKEAPIWLLCGPKKLTAAATDLAGHRREQGFKTIISSNDIAEAIRSCPRSPDFLLIVGDDGPTRAPAPIWRAPAKRGKLYRWRSVQEESFATDSAWADTDGDGIPEFSVGRIPARSADKVRTVVRKIIAYESRKLSAADLGLPIWGGTPAYGKLLDEGGTMMLLTTIRKRAPAWAEPWVMFGNPRSPLSAHPPDQPAIFNTRLAGGGMFSTMMGHGGPTLFHSQSTPTGHIDYHVGHAARLTAATPASPMVIFACDCGRFDGTVPSLAETLLFAPGGPVNVVAATTESHPLTNYYSSLALLEQMDAGHERFGSLWQAAQNSAYSKRRLLTDALLKNAEGALDAEIDIPKLKRDQLLMYALLGDPATRIPAPKPLTVNMEQVGEQWHWKIKKPHPSAKIEVGIRRPALVQRSKAPGTSPEKALQLFETRNAVWTFEPISEDWEGNCGGPGRLRFVATAMGSIYTFTQDLPD